MKLALIALAVIASVVSANAFECTSGKAYLTKSGYYGSINKSIYSDVEKAVANNDVKTLSKLKKDKSAIQLQEGTKVCVVDDDFYNKRKKIVITDPELTYWVSNDALNPIE